MTDETIVYWTCPVCSAYVGMDRGETMKTIRFLATMETVVGMQMFRDEEIIDAMPFLWLERAETVVEKHELVHGVEP